MPTVVANLKVKEDKIEEAKVALKQLSEETLAAEEGTLVYAVHQRQDDPTIFVFYEKYADDEAFKIHGKNLASKGALFAGILAGAPEIIMLEDV
ncbi:MAG: antibiotic biosynthesis monooxygenase [bacterium]|nr:antibiotic biosynthesis monooxygenase [bacterium]